MIENGGKIVNPAHLFQMFEKAKNWTIRHRETLAFFGVLILLLIAFFFSGYFVGRSENRIPIIIEKCGDNL